MRCASASFGTGHGNGRLVQDAPHAGRWREDVHSGVCPQQGGAYGQPLATRNLKHIEQDIGRIQIGADQQVGAAFEPIGRKTGVTQLGIQGAIALQLALARNLRFQAAEDFVRTAQLRDRKSVV